MSVLEGTREKENTKKETDLALREEVTKEITKGRY